MMFSIIMPVFNAGERYLQAAIKSVLSQSYHDFELILIDDGSTDGSAAICDNFRISDTRVRVLHQSNTGICHARNVGINMALGNYIMFCDHDDIFLPGYLACVAENIKSRSPKPDIVKVDIELAERALNGRENLTYCGDKLGSFTWAWPSEYNRFERLTIAVWDGAYKRSFLTKHSILFDERFRFGAEDFDYMLKVLRGTRHVIRIGSCFYRHYNNIGLSTSSKFHPERINDILYVAKLEKSSFPTTDYLTQLARYRRWNGVLLSCGLNLKGHPQSLSFSVFFANAMWKLLKPQKPRITLISSLPIDAIVFAILQRIHFMYVYIFIKSWIFCLSSKKYNRTTHPRDN